MVALSKIAGMAGIVLLGLLFGVLVTLTVFPSRAALPAVEPNTAAAPLVESGSEQITARSVMDIESDVSGANVGLHQERVKKLEKQHSLLRGQLDLVAAELETARTKLSEMQSSSQAQAQASLPPQVKPKPEKERAARSQEESSIIVVGAKKPPPTPPQTPLVLAPSSPPTPPGTSLLIKRPTTPISTESKKLVKPAPAPAHTVTKAGAAGAACPYDFKVYVYSLPPELDSVRLAAEARRNRTLHVCQKCILEQFALEYIIHDFFTQFCGRTERPEEADFFYLPLIRDAEYRVRLEERNNAKKRNPSPAEAALLLLREKNDSTLWNSVFRVPDTYWRRLGGGDHIIAMPAPITNLRHESSMRGFFHYMSHLHPPIFLGVEYSISFVREYPVCATQKNIVVPYPTTDPDLFSGKLHAEHIKRDSLLYYAGGLHGECMEIRRALKQLMVNASRQDHVVPSAKTNMAEREHGFLMSTFCPVPVGDSPSSKRMYDVMHFGCIPVIISDDLVFAFSLETGGDTDARQFAIQLPQSVVQFPTDVLLKKFGGPKGRQLWGSLSDGTSLFGLLQSSTKLPAYENGVYVNPIVHILRQVSPEIVAALQRGVAQRSGIYRYYSMDPSMTTIPTASGKLPDGEAIAQLASMLSRRKKFPGGLRNLTERCQAERFRKGHKYIARHPCDKDDHTSLKRRRLLQQGQQGEQGEHGASDSGSSSSTGSSGSWTEDYWTEPLHTDADVDREYQKLFGSEIIISDGSEEDFACERYFSKGGVDKNCSVCGDWRVS